jgi:hypothetical protein
MEKWAWRGLTFCIETCFYNKTVSIQNLSTF